MIHSGTAKQPYAEWEIEKAFLASYTPYTSPQPLIVYTLRKDNTISWKGNFYSVPLGTYKGRGSKVSLSIDGQYLVVKNIEGVEICRHQIAAGKGFKIKNTDHSRDKSAAIKEMIAAVCSLLDHPEKGMQFLSAFRNIIETNEKHIISNALDYCRLNTISSASDFKAIVVQYKQDNTSSLTPAKVLTMNPLNRSVPTEAFTQPATSDIKDYEKLLQTNDSNG